MEIETVMIMITEIAIETGEIDGDSDNDRR